MIWVHYKSDSNRTWLNLQLTTIATMPPVMMPRSQIFIKMLIINVIISPTL